MKRPIPKYLLVFFCMLFPFGQLCSQVLDVLRMYEIKKKPTIANPYSNFSPGDVPVIRFSETDGYIMACVGDTFNPLSLSDLYYFSFSLSGSKGILDIPFPIRDAIFPSSEGMILQKQSNNTSGSGLEFYSQVYCKRIAFPGLGAINQEVNLVERINLGGSGVAMPCAALCASSGLGPFGWFVLDDSLQWIRKRGFDIGFPNVGEGNGDFAPDGGFYYCSTSKTVANQRFAVISKSSPVDDMPSKVVKVERANGQHLSVSGLSVVSNGIVLTGQSDTEGSFIFMVNHSLDSILWSKHIKPFGRRPKLQSPPSEMSSGTLIGTVVHYDSVYLQDPIYPFFYWHYLPMSGYYGIDPESGTLEFSRHLSAVYSPSGEKTVFQPCVFVSGMAYFPAIFSNDHMMRIFLAPVDTLGNASCISGARGIPFEEEALVISQIPSFVTDTVANCSIVTLPGLGYNGTAHSILDSICECNVIMQISAVQTSALGYQFSMGNTLFTSGSWDFGDGSTFSGANPTHSFPGPGTYTVEFCNQECGYSCVQTAVNVPCMVPSAQFSSISSPGFAVSFSSNSLYLSNQTGSLSWDFGDGGTSTLSQVIHSYPSAGNYTVCLIASNGCGFDTVCSVVNVTCNPPVSAFTSNPNQLQANFVNTSIGALSQSWDFGDGNSSTSLQPSYIYAGSGTYQVCLISNNMCGQDTSCQSVVINCLPTVASFTHTLSSLSATFQNTSTNQGASLWDFGDGTFSVQVSPVHYYAQPGTYTVCLISTNTCGSDTSCTPVTVSCPLPTAAFISSTNLLAATFSNTSSGALSQNWTFGDGQGSNAISPTHSYAQPGTYTVCLISTNTCGSDSSCTPVTVSCPLPTAAFISSTNLLAATFSNTSSGALSQNWTFGDGQGSNAISPTHSYAQPGTYTVCLISTSTCGSDTSCIPVTVTCPLPNSAFTSSTNLLAATFINNSTGSLSWAWTFGDGQGSSAASPTHTYAQPGTYTVCLFSTNTCGSDTICTPVTVTCPPPTSAFTSSSNQLAATFLNSSSGALSLAWTFGDGQGSSASSPTHSYAQPGTYTVCLISTNTCGSDTSCSPVTVTCPLPNSAFTSSTNLLAATFINNSTGSLSWTWTFGDGQGSSAASPTHSYAQPGTYTVCLISTNTCGSDTICTPVTVTCPNITLQIQVNGQGSAYQFSAVATGSVVSYLWDFGDGTTATGPSASHNFVQGDTYMVCLKAWNGCDSAMTCTELSVLTAMEAAILGLDLSIYPQPADERAIVEIRIGEALGCWVRIHDALGRALYAQELVGRLDHRLNINTHDWPSGVYFFELEMEGKRMARKFLIQR